MATLSSTTPRRCAAIVAHSTIRGDAWPDEVVWASHSTAGSGDPYPRPVPRGGACCGCRSLLGGGVRRRGARGRSAPLGHRSAQQGRPSRSLAPSGLPRSRLERRRAPRALPLRLRQSWLAPLTARDARRQSADDQGGDDALASRTKEHCEAERGSTARSRTRSSSASSRRNGRVPRRTPSDRVGPCSRRPAARRRSASARGCGRADFLLPDCSPIFVPIRRVGSRWVAG